MNFEFTEIQRNVRSMMKDFVEREVKPIAMEYELADRYPMPIAKKMKELGFFGFTIPEEYGGGGMDEVCYAIAMEELSVGWMSVAGILGTHMMTAWMILHYGTEEQKRTYLPKIATGEWHSGIGHRPELGFVGQVRRDRHGCRPAWRAVPVQEIKRRDSSLGYGDGGRPEGRSLDLRQTARRAGRGIRHR